MMPFKKTERTNRHVHDMSHLGLTEIPDDFDVTGGVDGNYDDNDSDLEAELAAIMGSNKNSLKPKAQSKPTIQLDNMVASCLKDIESDDDDSTDEQELMNELQDITVNKVEINSEQTAELPQQQNLPNDAIDTVALIRQRLEMYVQAEANAKAAGDAAKSRRIGRGLKVLKDLLKQANAGKPINVEEIPPEVSVNLKKINNPTPITSLEETKETPPDEVSQPAQENTEVEKSKEEIVELLRSRQKEYKIAALEIKRNGDTTKALQFMKVVKQFDLVLNMLQNGQEIDLSDMPPPPDKFLEFLAKMQAEETPNEPDTAVVVSPENPSSLLEALEERFDKYKSVENAAKAEGNASKARRFGRIVKQYEDAIEACKTGLSVSYDELPVPPGFGPLPKGSPSSAAKPIPSNDESTISPSVPQSISVPTPVSTISKDVLPQKQELTTRITGNHQRNNLAEEQMKIILTRQKEFKMAALEAKKAGEIDQAKEYLKIYKGFDSLLNAASSGLPVDLNTLPLPPSQREHLEASFSIVGDDLDSDDMSDISVRVEEQLAKQLIMCKNTRDHHKAMGDIAGMNRFENLALTVQKDLDLVRYSKRKNFPLPKFHYEKRSFNIVHCNTELSDNELEIVVVSGINYKVANPKDVDTYVKVEFSLPNDEIFKTKTNIIKDTDSPSYDQRFTVEIQRNSRAFQRIFKRHGVKFEVYSRGGFLRSDVLIGTVNVKLQPLETKCDIHDTFNLMDGRKPIGGKLEVKLRVRNPILTKQMEHINEKWLVLDG